MMLAQRIDRGTCRGNLREGYQSAERGSIFADGRQPATTHRESAWSGAGRQCTEVGLLQGQHALAAS